VNYCDGCTSTPATLCFPSTTASPAWKCSIFWILIDQSDSTVHKTWGPTHKYRTLVPIHSIPVCLSIISIIADVQFLLFMKNITNLSTYEIEIIFNLLDIDHSGEIEFDEFYLVFCILIACKVCTFTSQGFCLLP
jgi:hypothetical protein